MCGFADESKDHMFVSYPQVTETWTMAANFINPLAPDITAPEESFRHIIIRFYTTPQGETLIQQEYRCF